MKWNAEKIIDLIEQFIFMEPKKYKIQKASTAKIIEGALVFVEHWAVHFLSHSLSEKFFTICSLKVNQDIISIFRHFSSIYRLPNTFFRTKTSRVDVASSRTYREQLPNSKVWCKCGFKF